MSDPRQSFVVYLNDLTNEQTIVVDIRKSVLERHPEYFLELKTLVENSPLGYFSALRHKSKHILQWIDSQLSIAMINDPVSLRCYWILNGLLEPPECRFCHSQLTVANFGGIRIGYGLYCSAECCRKDTKFHVHNMKQTNLKKYGVECYSQTAEFKHKSEETSLRHFGTKWPSQSKEVMNKVQNTNLKKYGNKCSMHGEKQEKKTKATWQTKYGASNPMKSDQIKQKVSDTIKSFSDEKKAKIRMKCQQTCFEHFEVDHQFKSEVVQNKCKQTCLAHFGEDNYFKTRQNRENLSDPKKAKARTNKAFESRRKNGTFNISASEDKGLKLLIAKFGEDDVLTQFKSDLYPWHCDYYVKSLDLYIELNEHWSHGGHAYDPNSREDRLLVEHWKSKQSKYYDNCVYVWTSLDVQKMQAAVDNSLHYLVFWNICELEAWTIGDANFPSKQISRVNRFQTII